MRYIMGSRHFFHNMPGFKPHDTDYIELVDNPDFDKKRVIRINKMDLIQLKRKPKQILIQEALEEPLPLVVGKFLIPDFNAEIGLTIEDLKQLQPLIDKLDEKHKYEKIIYESYLANKSFILTDEQRLMAYQSYKESRVNVSNNSLDNSTSK